MVDAPKLHDDEFKLVALGYAAMAATALQDSDAARAEPDARAIRRSGRQHRRRSHATDIRTPRTPRRNLRIDTRCAAQQSTAADTRFCGRDDPNAPRQLSCAPSILEVPVGDARDRDQAVVHCTTRADLNCRSECVRSSSGWTTAPLVPATDEAGADTTSAGNGARAIAYRVQQLTEATLPYLFGGVGTTTRQRALLID